MLEGGFESRLRFEFTGFRMSHFLKLSYEVLHVVPDVLHEICTRP